MDPQNDDRVNEMILVMTFSVVKRKKLLFTFIFFKTDSKILKIERYNKKKTAEVQESDWSELSFTGHVIYHVEDGSVSYD
ncbi:hypothetical protein QJS10_CPA01g01748 [Acorus calamus]|uniref:Uncharacterized protein n=1 Tax=Acorus calamus TaxID=4465 RepID=A0AAV9FJG5_ACOCL|nr:hypothetical protein QJS10_CPA01g01748 [Acorus calamus]